MSGGGAFDLEKFPATGVGALQQDATDRGLKKLRADVTGGLAAQSTYAPARPLDWADPPPTTIAEAIDRIAYHVSSGAGGAPILGLP